MKKIVESVFKANLAIHQMIASDESFKNQIVEIAQLCIACFQNKGKVLFCGNGGSAADAQHLAAELSGRFYLNRAPLFAEALHVNSSYLTAVANDLEYDQVFSRLVEAKGRKGDVLIAISTSGNSKNIVNACRSAKDVGMSVIGLNGAKRGTMGEFCDTQILVPSEDTPRIQESHILIGHILCQLIESTLFGE